MRPETSVRPPIVVRLVTAGAIAAILASCAGTPTATSPASPSAAVSPASSGQPSATAAATQSAEQVIADLRSKLQGRKIVVGTSAFPDPTTVGAERLVQYLREDYGLDVDFRSLDSDPLVAAMVAGQVDVGQLSLAFTAAAKGSGGADFFVFAGDSARNYFAVVGKGAVQSMEDLRGKTFAATSSLTSITGLTAKACFQKAGMDIEKDSTIVFLGNAGNVMDAVVGNQVAAGLTLSIFIVNANLKEPGTYHNICDGYQALPQINDVWISSRGWFGANPDAALAIAISAIKVGRWAHSSKEEWITIALGTDDTLTREAAELNYADLVEKQDQWPVNGALDRALCDETMKIALESGSIEQPMTCDEVLTFEFQDRALEILGRV